MPIFNSIFGGCSSADTQKEETEELKREIDRLQTRMELLERDFAIGVRSLNDRIDMKLSILESKIDNLVLLLTNR